MLIMNKNVLHANVTSLLLRSKILVVLFAMCTMMSANVSSVITQQLTAETQSVATEIDGTVNYTFQWANTSDHEQTVAFELYKPRELACTSTLSQERVTLKANDVFNGTLTVVMSDRIPVGGFELCILLVKDTDGNELSRLPFITSCANEHPFLLVTDELLAEASSKVANYTWAKDNLDNMLIEMDKYNFPKQKIVTKPRPTQVWSSLNYVAADGEKAFKLAIAYRLSGEKKYYDKLMNFIDVFTNPESGYLSVGAATTGVMVHEGNFFLHLAAACDIIYDELSEKDKENIVDAFRLYLKQNRTHMNSIGIMNHQASANAGAILVALYLQDVAEVDHLTDAEGGMADQISKGVMADGWWFECTVNYCYLVTQRYCLVAQAFENYGWDLFHKRFPTKFKSRDFENAKEGFTGMRFDNWGPMGKSTRGVEDMVSPYVCMMDEDAVVVSSNDSGATPPDNFYEIAYRQYRQDDLAWVISKTDRSSWVSLMYGVGELPTVADPRTKSATLPNVGITALRSQDDTRTSKEQIQAYVKYGTHGGWHGQFDRTGLLALDRNGHKYFATEMVWYGYGHAGYKECVQTSATHNMVIVDELQQEAVPSEELLFYAGDKMQVSVTQTVARWRSIPTFNIDIFPPWNDTPYDDNFGAVLQRRLSVVTADYMVMADFMSAPQARTYDWLIHPIGLLETTGLKVKGKKLDVVNADEMSPYKYFKNGQWHKMSKGAKVQFQEEEAKLDVYALWPKKAEVLISDYPNGGAQRHDRNNPERRTLGIRVSAEEVMYLTVLEPYEGESMIKSVTSDNDQTLRVELTDGRVQVINIEGLRGQAKDIKVSLLETFNGVENTESTQNL